MTTLTTLESFTGGADGGNPGYGALLMDSSGDLFGTTLSGGALGGGTAFELVHTSAGYTLRTLVSFDPASTVSGNTPFGGLTADANGDLFGVTAYGGASNSGTVFELVNTGSGYTFQTLASFSGANGSSPMGTLLADANGDLFGATQSGGPKGEGTVFEMVRSASGYSLQTLYMFNYTDGAAPTGPLTSDAAGDLFGTTLSGGSGGQGTVFELVNTGSGYSFQTLASFSGANGSLLYAGVTADAQGDLFGATYMGGADGYGVIYELVHGGSGYTMRTIATLDNAATGGNIIGGLTLDAQGDIFGTAEMGGPGGFGTVFELVHSGSGYTFQTLYAFSGGASGGLPEGGVALDTAGNLYGTTAGGGSGYGTVFEFGSAAANDGGAAEQANLALKVNGGSANPIGAAGVAHVAFTIAGLQTGDTGVVTFTDAANHTVTVNVAAGVTGYTADLSSLANGAVSASLQVATNSVGDVFRPVAGNGVTLDTVAPAQPGAPGDAAVHNGYLNAAGDTATQTIGGTVEPGAGVTVYDNGFQVASVTADVTTGAWSYQIGALANGTSHSYAVTATDAAGNVSPMSAALVFAVDTVAPTPMVENVTGAAHGMTVVTGVSEAGSTVSLYDSGLLVGAATADSSGAWSVAAKLNGGAAHQFTETAVDQALNTGASTGSAYWANPGNKTFVGAAGDDVFIGRKGDTLTGGSGHNHYVMDIGFGSQTVTNFAHGQDQIWFDHTLFGSAAQALAHAHQSGSSTVIIDAAGDQLVLQHVQASTLLTTDFHLF